MIPLPTSVLLGMLLVGFYDPRTENESFNDLDET